MPALVCSAQNCVYNNAMYCSRGNIDVAGEEAKACQDTCCASFKERELANLRSAVGTPTTNTEIDCKAKNCKYNEKCKCRAIHVDISGAAACRCEQTECVTFTDAK